MVEGGGRRRSSDVRRLGRSRGRGGRGSPEGGPSEADGPSGSEPQNRRICGRMGPVVPRSLHAGSRSLSCNRQDLLDEDLSGLRRADAAEGPDSARQDECKEVPRACLSSPTKPGRWVQNGLPPANDQRARNLPLRGRAEPWNPRFGGHSGGPWLGPPKSDASPPREGVGGVWTPPRPPWRGRCRGTRLAPRRAKRPGHGFLGRTNRPSPLPPMSPEGRPLRPASREAGSYATGEGRLGSPPQ